MVITQGIILGIFIHIIAQIFIHLVTKIS